MDFDLTAFFESDAQTGTVPVTVGQYTFHLRPLNGIESEEYGERNRQVDRGIYLIARGLAESAGAEPVGDEKAAKLYARSPALALELAARIYELTETVWREEAARWSDAKKNSSRTPISGSGAPTAGNTD